MEHLGVELDGPNALCAPKGSVSNILGAADDLEAVGNGGDGIAVGHPYLRVLLEALEQRVLGVYGL